MLCLLFQIGNERYALEAGHAVEVIPYLSLRKIPRAPRGVAGIFNYRGRPVPALDLSELTLGVAARERMSTRILLVNVKDSAGQDHLLGLIAEHATEMTQRDERDFVDPRVQSPDTPFLGPVAMDDKGAVQLLRPQHLLGERLRALLNSTLPDLKDETH